jgi:hypothetical protein
MPAMRANAIEIALALINAPGSNPAPFIASQAVRPFHQVRLIRLTSGGRADKHSAQAGPAILQVAGKRRQKLLQIRSCGTGRARGSI